MTARYAPFPVETPYRTGPVVTKLARSPDGLTQHFVVDSAYAAYLEQKLTRLSRYPERCGGLLDGEGLEGALWHALEHVAQEQPELVALTAETVTLRALGIKLRRSSRSGYTVCTSADTPSSLGQRAAAHLSSLTSQPSPLVLLHALALCVQEDVVLLEEREGTDRVAALCVAFPSHWDPQAQLGRNFSDLHKPVAHNRALLSAHRPVMNALFHKGPFVRFVWGLSADDALSQHPADERVPLPQEVLSAPDRLAHHLTFRTERQVSCPLPGGYALFTIRVAGQPLQEALGNNPERHRRLAAALASMDDALLAYKGLIAWRDPLLEYLDTAPANAEAISLEY